MSEKLDSIINSIAELSVLELSELVKALEDKFGVTAAAPMAFAAAPAAGVPARVVVARPLERSVVRVASPPATASPSGPSGRSGTTWRPRPSGA